MVSMTSEKSYGPFIFPPHERPPRELRDQRDDEAAMVLLPACPPQPLSMRSSMNSTLNDKSNSSKLVTGALSMIAGVNKHLSKVPSFTVAGKTYTPSEVVAIYQDRKSTRLNSSH